MSAHDVRNLIIDDVIDVWGVQKQYIVERVLEPTVYPFCLIRLNNIRREFNGVKSVQSEYRFIITLVDKINPSVNLEQVKELKALALTARLEGGATYAGCYLPQVVNIDFEESDNPAELTYSISVEFLCYEDEVRA